MVVEAITDDNQNIPEPIRNFAWQQREDGRLPLTIGKKYVVSGIRRTRGFEFFLVIADENEFGGRPWWYLSDLFKTLDSIKPSDWVEGGVDQDRYFSFPELAKDDTGHFENNLEDGEPKELAVFLKHYEQYARAHNLWYVDGRPNKPKNQWEQPSSLPKQARAKKYEDDLKLAKERGYEWPEKPED